MRATRKLRSHWAIRNYYAIIVIVGVVLFFSAGPLTSSLAGSEEEIAIASEYFEKGLEYKGKDFLEWRDGPLWLGASMWYAGLALAFAGVMIGVLESWHDSIVGGAISNFFRLKNGRP